MLGPQAAIVDARLAALSPRAEPDYDFDTPELTRTHRVLARLVRASQQLAGADGLRARIVARRARAHDLLGLDPATRRAWSEARASIADRAECPLYGGNSIEVQRGLVPLRRNPESGLWEFWHELSGERPTLADGRWRIGAETGVVLVLMPGGEQRVGAAVGLAPEDPDYDPLAQSQDGPPLSVVLDPFFMAAHEFTQAQWARLAGTWPSCYGVGDRITSPPFEDVPRVRPTNPVESVTWLQADALLARWGLRLPTEAQWEHGSRANTRAPAYWTEAARIVGDKVPALDLPRLNSGHLKLLSGYPLETALKAWDGWAVHAPVGSYAPNGFGLYDMAGNVAEWCRDWYATDLGEHELVGVIAGGTGEFQADEPLQKSIRGGSYRSTKQDLRHAARHGANFRELRDDLGLRAVKLLQH